MPEYENREKETAPMESSFVPMTPEEYHRLSAPDKQRYIDEGNKQLALGYPAVADRIEGGLSKIMDRQTGQVVDAVWHRSVVPGQTELKLSPLDKPASAAESQTSRSVARTPKPTPPEEDKYAGRTGYRGPFSNPMDI